MERDRPGGPEETYRGYQVYDQHYEKVGKVDVLFVDESDNPEFIGVKTGLLGTKATLIPMEIVRVNDRRGLMEVAADRDTISRAPAFEDDEEITPEHEADIHAHFGLEHPARERGGYGDYYSSEQALREEELRHSVDTEYGERRSEPLPPNGETTSAGPDVPPEVRPQTDATEAGSGRLRVYKRVQARG
ncbi:MAG: PRC-barrel domain-containing protein [Actinomycetota bacterium]